MPPSGPGAMQAAPRPVIDSHPVVTAARIVAGSARQVAAVAWHSFQSGSFEFMFACACDFGLHASPLKRARPNLMDVPSTSRTQTGLRRRLFCQTSGCVFLLMQVCGGGPW